MPDLVLFSGGLDSTVLLYDAIERNPDAGVISFDFGQPSIREELYAVAQFKHHLDFSGPVLKIPMLRVETYMGSGGDGPRVLPGRNLIMLAYAQQYAAMNGFDRVVYGATKDDHDDYPDCTPRFVGMLSQATWLDTKVRVAIPLAGHTKAQVVERGRELNVPFDWTWSCYQPVALNRPCGECASCVAREAALS